MNTSTKPTVLVVEDETRLADIVIEYLHSAELATHHLADGNAVIPWIKAHQPALVLLDIMLPNRDGIDICRELRQFSDIPVLMVTARADEIDRILGLEIGADDYICKPFSPRELVARVRANLRRHGAITARPAATDPALQIDRDKLQVSSGGNRVQLTAVEFRLLEHLAAHSGVIFSRSQLIDACYTDHRVVSERTIDSHIKKLRQQLQQLLPENNLIQSVYGVGYKYDPTDTAT